MCGEEDWCGAGLGCVLWRMRMAGGDGKLPIGNRVLFPGSSVSSRWRDQSHVVLLWGRSGKGSKTGNRSEARYEKWDRRCEPVSRSLTPSSPPRGISTPTGVDHHCPPHLTNPRLMPVRHDAHSINTLAIKSQSRRLRALVENRSRYPTQHQVISPPGD